MSASPTAPSVSNQLGANIFQVAPNRLCLRIAIACLVVMAGLMIETQACPAQSVNSLQWKLTTGDQFQVTFVQESETNTDVDGRKTVIDSSTTLTMDWVVKKADADKNFVIEQTISNIVVAVGNPAIPATAIKFDTLSKAKVSRESKKIRTQMAPLIGLKFDVAMSPQGEIISVQPQTATVAVLRTLPDSMQLQKLYTEKGLKDLFGAAAIVLPSEELDPGQSWEDTEPVDTAFGKFSRTRAYKFVGTDSESLFADFSIETTMKPVANAAEQGKVAEPKPTMVSFSETGSMRLDIEGGYFVSSQTSSTTNTTAPYREKSIDTTVKSSTRMSIQKK